MNKYNLKSTDILNKKFEVELSGYSASEVDRYLDKVLEDYKTYEEQAKVNKETIMEISSVISEKEDDISSLTLELQNLKEQLSKTSSISNMELANEIKSLKEKIFKK